MGKAKKAGQRRITTVGRDLESVHRFAYDLLRQHDLNHWSVYWAVVLEADDGGGVTRAFTERIVFSAAHLAVMSKEQRRGAVRHEVAHAIAGVGSSHGAAWVEVLAGLGGTGGSEVHVPWQSYPWRGSCPDEHPFVSMRAPGPLGFACEDPSHDEPVPLAWHKWNTRSLANDPGVAMMAEKYPEPESFPQFAVGDEVRIRHFGSPDYDGVPLTITAVNERDYLTRRLDTGDEVTIAHEGVEPLAGTP